MALYAVVSPSTTVTNLVSWDGVSTYNVSPNTLVLATGQPNAQVGGTYVGGVFTAPAAPAPAQGIIFQNSPVSGASIQLPAAPQPQAKLYAYLTPASALAALTLLLPTSPQDGDVMYVFSTQAITTLTVTPASGQSRLNFPASFALAANTAQYIAYSAQISGWLHT